MKQTERLVWIAIAAIILAWHFLGAPGRGSTDAAGSPSTSPAPHRSADRLPGMEPHSSPARTTRSGSAGRSTPEARSLTALRSTDPLIRLSAFLEVLSSCGSGDIEEVSAALAGLKAAGISLPLEEDLLNFRAGQLKGAELMAGRSGTSGDLAMLEIHKKQFDGWIHADRISAGRWLDGLPAGRYRDQMAVAYIAACSKDDPGGSLALVSSLHPSQQAAAGRAVAARLAESASAEDAAAMLRDLPAGGGTSQRYLSSFFDSLVATAAKDGSPLAFTLVEENIGQPYVNRATLTRLSTERAKSDPQGALAWAVSLEGRKGDMPGGELVASAIHGMDLEGLREARAWAATQQEGEAYWLRMIDRRESLLEDSGGDNAYDRDD